MKPLKFNLSFILILLLANIVITLCSKQTYIVHMDVTHKPSDQTHHSWYASHLNSLSIDPDKHLIYAYATVLHGFAAVLDSDHVLRLRSHPAVLHLHPDPVLGLHTTRSPHFLGLLDPSIPSTSLPDAGAAVVVGVLDTGVWPESASFSDAGVPKPPEKWKGKCEEADDFSPRVCNKKLIGARSFSKGAAVAGAGEKVSPRDTDGHGSHTASTAAGAAVTNASLFGYAPGTARGMAPRAHVATYKVCWKSGCFGSDILAGMETAIADGVDVLSLSLGGGSTEYFQDTIAVGAFAAAEKGVFVACSAGNSGPRVGSLANTAPWIATVGAGTLDRDFPAHVSLGNGRHFTGVSLHSGKGMGAKPAPLVYFSGKNRSNLCLPGTVDPARAKGKVVFCDRGVNARVEKGAVVKAAGGVGMVLANAAANGEELVADSHLLPALAVGTTEGDLIREYARSDENPTALIRFGGTVLGVKPSPVVAAFSSRGPNGVVPEILKPDLIGPGVNILAAWSRAVGPTGLRSDGRRTDFNIMSGTSMSCPHISGVAALLKAAHPDWSPAAIKSALITTAYTTSNTNSPLIDAAGGGAPASPFALGSGHVNPHNALDPGLIYDATPDDYLSFLCALRYNPAQIQTITKRPNVTCKGRGRNPGNLNYPSFAVAFGRRGKVTYVREVTNVGEGSGVWSVRVEGVRGVKITVRPRRIVFGGVGEKVKYKVRFESKTSGNSSVFGWISWSSGKYVVRSPVACSWSRFL